VAQVILVSNRLPVSIRRAEGKTTLERSSGGLVAGLSPLHDEGDSLWIGNLGVRDASSLSGELRDLRFVNVDIPQEMGRRYYNGFSNGVLWPVLHHFIETFEFDRRDYEAYQAVNERFADAIAQRARPDGRTLVWIHDYQLMLLPELVRRRMPDARIGFFLHTPFPPAEIFEVVPGAAELLRSLAQADVVGVHTEDYAHHLLRTFRRELGASQVDERRNRAGGCRVEVHPIGVDAAGLEARAASAAVERKLEIWRRRAGSRKVILGVDRLDYTKGLPLRFAAFRELLETDRRWSNDALFIQVAVPTRTGVRAYRRLKEEVERRVGEINGRYARGGHVPLWYLYRSVSPAELSTLYRLADVLLVTPLRDGMNLVAKEYVASRLDDSGALVLSRFAGAANELKNAFLVNPWDEKRTAETLGKVLLLDPDEQRRRMKPMRRRVREHDALRWGREFMDSLGGRTGGAGAGATRRIPTQPGQAPVRSVG
jgi:trehalose 6-phosphate synthase/phosphatase